MYGAVKLVFFTVQNSPYQDVENLSFSSLLTDKHNGTHVEHWVFLAICIATTKLMLYGCDLWAWIQI